LPSLMAAAQSPFSCRWKPCLPAAIPLTATLKAVPLLSSVMVTVPIFSPTPASDTLLISRISCCATETPAATVKIAAAAPSIWINVFMRFSKRRGSFILHWMPPLTELNHLLNLPCRPRFLTAGRKAFALAKIDICFHRIQPSVPSASGGLEGFSASHSICDRGANDHPGSNCVDYVDLLAQLQQDATLQHACRCHTTGSERIHAPLALLSAQPTA